MDRIKYPRTRHVPSSPGATSDDKVLTSLDGFVGKAVVVTEKMDGENTTGYWDGYIHARSRDSRHHKSRAWVKQFLADRLWQLPEGWRICGENVYARHSIEYYNLDTYFFAFSLWDRNNYCLSWADTLLWLKLLGINPVKTLWTGTFDSQQHVQDTILAVTNSLNLDQQEGFVVRVVDSFHYDAFDQCVAKWVRAEHVKDNQHWMQKSTVANRLASG